MYDVTKGPLPTNPVLRRLVKEIRRESSVRIVAYDRVYTRHMGGGGYDRVYNRHMGDR